MKRQIINKTLLGQVPIDGICEVECGCILKRYSHQFEHLWACKNGHSYQHPDCIGQSWGIIYHGHYDQVKAACLAVTCKIRYKTWDFYWDSQSYQSKNLTFNLALEDWTNHINAIKYYLFPNKIDFKEFEIAFGENTRFYSVLIKEDSLSKYRQINLVIEHDEKAQRLGTL